MSVQGCINSVFGLALSTFSTEPPLLHNFSQ